MRLFAFSAAILLLQTVILPRVNLFGAVPDLVLVSAVAFAVLNGRTPATIYSAVMGFAQDLFSSGIYLNLIFKTIFSNLAVTIREEYSEEEFTLTALLTAGFSLVYALGEGLVLVFLYHKQISLLYFIYKLLASTTLNLAVAALVFPLIKRLTRAD